MSFPTKQQVPLLTVAAIAVTVVALVLLRPPPDDGVADGERDAGAAGAHAPAPEPRSAAATGQPPDADDAPAPDETPAAGGGGRGLLSVLAEEPDWQALDGFQQTITRSDFERLLTTVFTTSDAWRGFIVIDDSAALIHTGRAEPEDVFVLNFVGAEPAPLPRHWLASHELPPAPADKPLAGLHIAIDPGHIGGEWAKMEERWFLVGDGLPVCEGDMTLKVAELLKPQLEQLGATVSLVRDSAEPVTTLRPESLASEAQDAHASPEDSPASLRRFAERLFYRTAEIRARANLVNQTIRPDLVLCLHFNAEGWGNPAKPTLVKNSHLHLLLNGAYTDDEVILDDQRFAMLVKLLQRTHEEEARVGATVADVFAEASGLPPYRYHADSRNALPVNNHPYLWARNLLANRLYDCPVIYMEPYVMNSVTDHARIQAGDYKGLREIADKQRPSIFREYADAMAAGLATHYAANRPLADP